MDINLLLNSHNSNHDDVYDYDDISPYLKPIRPYVPQLSPEPGKSWKQLPATPGIYNDKVRGEHDSWIVGDSTNPHLPLNCQAEEPGELPGPADFARYPSEPLLPDQDPETAAPPQWLGSLESFLPLPGSQQQEINNPPAHETHKLTQLHSTSSLYEEQEGLDVTWSNRPDTPRFGTPASISDGERTDPPIGGYQCLFPGCTAQPFKTLYMLNSHMNVHSQIRPHYCSVKGCPRGEGGKGFKRKNEMIRHGLVHYAPGYVCPFCPDQKHIYPMPDNLQRHVRVDHVDKQKDDPLLQDVLAQSVDPYLSGRVGERVFEPGASALEASSKSTKSSSIEQSKKSRSTYVCQSPEPPSNSPRHEEPIGASRGHVKEDIVIVDSIPTVRYPPQRGNLTTTTEFRRTSIAPGGNNWVDIFEVNDPPTPAIHPYDQSDSNRVPGVEPEPYKPYKWTEDEVSILFDTESIDDELPGPPESTSNVSFYSTQSQEISNKHLGPDKDGIQGGLLNAVEIAVQELEEPSPELDAVLDTFPYNPTDSGYASMGHKQEADTEQRSEDWDDVQTVCTDKQDLDIAEDVKQKLSLALSVDIIERIKMSIHGVGGNRSSRQAISDILKEFAIRLRQIATPGQQRDATVFVRHYRHRIASLLEDSMIILSRNEETEEPPKEEVNDEMELKDIAATGEECLSIAEKMALWSNSSNSGTGEPPAEISVEAEVEEEAEDFAIAHFPDSWKFLTTSNAYEWLIGKIRSEMTLTSSIETVSLAIKHTIYKHLDLHALPGNYSKMVHKADFVIHWPIHEFLRAQYPAEKPPRLGTIITITGSGVNAQALTCTEYMRQVWPTTGLQTLDILQAAMNAEHGVEDKWITADRSCIGLTFRNSNAYAKIQGTQPAIAEIGQQLAWLSAALRSSSCKHRLAYSTPIITALPSINHVAKFAMTFQLDIIESRNPSSPLNGTCWQNLFHSSVVVQGFPILARSEEETGLEIPLAMMAGLGEATRATTFDDGLVLKGFSTILCPTKRIKNSILWHYLFEDDGSRISYLAADERCPERLRTHNVDASCLKLTRNFLGWSSSVDIRIGTKDVKYEDIEWPKTKFASPGIAFEKASIIAGNFITGGASFTRGNKDTPLYLRREGPYEQEIHAARNMKVVLFDTRQRKGWLIDGAMALLHLTRTQLASAPYSEAESDLIAAFNHANPAEGTCAAKKVLLDPSNRELVLFPITESYTETKMGNGHVRKEETRTTTKNWTYQDLVRQAYHILEQMYDYESKALTSPSVGLRLTDRDKLTGFAFMDIVDGQNDIRPRVEVLSPSGKGWVDFTRSIRAITLLGRGFGELIIPSKDSNALCKQWSQVPTGKDYLVACASTLKEICRKYGDHESRPMELANDIYWHKPDKLFDPCKCKSTDGSKSCDRVQVLLPPSLGAKNHPQPFGSMKGAVIFGRSKRQPWRWPSKGGRPVEGGQSDSELDNDSEFADSGLGGSNVSTAVDTAPRTQDSLTTLSSDDLHSIDLSDLTMSGALKDGGSTSPSSQNSGEHARSETLDGTQPFSADTQATPAENTAHLAASKPQVNVVPPEHGIESEDTTMSDALSSSPDHLRGVKRTWEKVKGLAPQLVSAKRARKALELGKQKEA